MVRTWYILSLIFILSLAGCKTQPREASDWYVMDFGESDGSNDGRIYRVDFIDDSSPGDGRDLDRRDQSDDKADQSDRKRDRKGRDSSGGKTRTLPPVKIVGNRQYRLDRSGVYRFEKTLRTGPPLDARTKTPPAPKVTIPARGSTQIINGQVYVFYGKMYAGRPLWEPQIIRSQARPTTPKTTTRRVTRGPDPCPT